MQSFVNLLILLMLTFYRRLFLMADFSLFLDQGDKPKARVLHLIQISCRMEERYEGMLSPYSRKQHSWVILQKDVINVV